MYLITARKSRLPGRHGREPPQNSPASRPRWTSKASMASRKLVRAPRQPRLPPPPYCAAAAARPSDATAGPDRDQRDLLCPPTRPAGAARRGGAIIQRPSGARAFFSFPKSPLFYERVKNSGKACRHRPYIRAQSRQDPRAPVGIEHKRRRSSSLQAASPLAEGDMPRSSAETLTPCRRDGFAHRQLELGKTAREPLEGLPLRHGRPVRSGSCEQRGLSLPHVTREERRIVCRCAVKHCEVALLLCGVAPRACCGGLQLEQRVQQQQQPHCRQHCRHRCSEGAGRHCHHPRGCTPASF